MKLEYISRVSDLLSLSMSSGSHLNGSTLVLARLLGRLVCPRRLCALQTIFLISLFLVFGYTGTGKSRLRQKLYFT